jgi:hypothetical protein
MMDLFTAAQARDEAIARAAVNAALGWNDLMFVLVERTARQLVSFTSDDVFDLYDAMQNRPETHDYRAFGGVMVRAAKAGFCRKTDRVSPSRRVSLHASPRAIWISLLARGS